LRASLERRAQVRQRAAEAQKMAEKDSSREVEDLRKECEQQRLVARAGVAFAHDRLQQLKKDFTADGETANAMMTAARDKLRMNAIARPEYEAFDKEILRSRRDIARAQSIIERALGANASADVPAPHGTFLQRMGIGQARRNTPDILLAYMSAVLLVLAIFAPSVGTLSLLSAAFQFGSEGGAALLFLAPLALAAAAGAITFVGERTARGWLYLAAWMSGLVVAAYLIHEADYSLSSVAARFRLGMEWYLRPGVILALAGIFGLLVAAAAATWPQRKLRAWPAIAGIIGAAAVGLIVTDVGGAIRPSPHVDVVLTPGDTGAGIVRVSNEGGRTIRLLDRRPDAQGTYLFLIERRVGAASWGESRGTGALWENTPAADSGVLYTLTPGDRQEVGFVLPPGDYRVLLDAPRPELSLVEEFTLEGPAPVADTSAPVAGAPVFAPSAAASIPASIPGESGTNDATSPPPIPGESQEDEVADVTPDDESLPEETTEDMPLADPNVAPFVELTGVATSEEDEPRFSLRIYYSDGTEERLLLTVGGVVWGEWTITEFDPDQATVTLQSPEGLLILRRRVEVPLTTTRETL
jgi:hypothetical protein